MDDEYPLAVVPDSKSALAPVVDLVRAGRGIYDEVKGNAKPLPVAQTARPAAGMPKWAIVAAVVGGVVLVGGLLAFAFRKSA